MKILGLITDLNQSIENDTIHTFLIFYPTKSMFIIIDDFFRLSDVLLFTCIMFSIATADALSIT